MTSIAVRSCYIFQLNRSTNSKWLFLDCATIACSERYSLRDSPTVQNCRLKGREWEDHFTCTTLTLTINRY